MCTLFLPPLPHCSPVRYPRFGAAMLCMRVDMAAHQTHDLAPNRDLKIVMLCRHVHMAAHHIFAVHECAHGCTSHILQCACISAKACTHTQPLRQHAGGTFRWTSSGAYRGALPPPRPSSYDFASKTPEPAQSGHRDLMNLTIQKFKPQARRTCP